MREILAFARMTEKAVSDDSFKATCGERKK